MVLLNSLTGIGRYNYEIAKYLNQAHPYDCTFFYGYFSKRLVESHPKPRTYSIYKMISRYQFIKYLLRKFIQKITLLGASQFDLYWQPNFIALSGIKAQKTVVTVHDFSWEHYPEFHPKERINYFQQNFYQSLKRCDHIITGSYFTKTEIMQRTPFTSDNITVIYHGIDHSLFYPRQQKNLEQKFILAVGSIEPRKNLKNLLLAYAALPLHVKETYHLILVGAAGWNNEDIMMLIAQQHPFVAYSGYVDDETLAKLYSDAELFIYPSFYEGFGIPPLEAMACGTPVVCSNASTLPEVCGDAAYYVDPYDKEAIRDALVFVLENETLQQQLRAKGLLHAKKFSWGKSAQEHDALFQKLLCR